MSMGSQPSPPSPQQSAAAEAEAELAGQMFEAENAPVLGYENAITSAMVSPYENELQATENERNAYEQAAANPAIEYATNPQQYEAQQMQMQGANARLASLYGVAPSNYSYSSPGAFTLPSTLQLPSSGTIGGIARAIGSQLGGVGFGNNTVSFLNPSNPQDITVNY